MMVLTGWIVINPGLAAWTVYTITWRLVSTLIELSNFSWVITTSGRTGGLIMPGVITEISYSSMMTTWLV